MTMSSAALLPSWLSEPRIEEWLQNSVDGAVPIPKGLALGCQLAIITALSTLALEVLSFNVALSLAKKNPKLYVQGWLSSLFNAFVLIPISTAIQKNYLCSEETFSTSGTALCVASIVVFHSIAYYAAHRLMHTKALYWAHSFHHKYNTHVVPSSANAVSLVEYNIAYVLPFLAAVLMIRPQPNSESLKMAVEILTFTNLFVHTPTLEALASRVFPSWVVGAHTHIAHHRKLSSHYASPTLNIDHFIAMSSTLTAWADKAFTAAGGKPVAVQTKTKAR